MRKFKVGDKVVPHSKSTGMSFEDSDFFNKDVEYTTIIRIDVDGDYETETEKTTGGEFYKEEDLTLYQEPSQSSLKVEDLVPGEVYYWKFENYTYLAKCKNNYNISEHIYLQNQEFTNSTQSTRYSTALSHDSRWSIREATPKEVEWLEQCVRANKYVDYVEPATTTELTELPENWCIKVTRNQTNHPEVREWRNMDWFDEGYIHSTKNWSLVIANGYLEITTEQFKKWVLCEETAETKKLELVQGIWYHDKEWVNSTDYVKLTVFDGDILFFDCYIQNKMYSAEGQISHEEGWSYNLETLREVPLSEIQEFLPEGHPDRFNTVKVPKITEPQAETNLEKAKRLYPIGTGIKCARDGEISVIGELEETDLGIIWKNSRGYYQYIYYKEEDRWAEILDTAESKPETKSSGLVKGYWYEVLDDEDWKFIQFQRLDGEGDYRGVVIYNDGDRLEDDFIYSTREVTQVDYSVVERFIASLKETDVPEPTSNVVEEPEQKGEVVHCTTQEEWDTVLSVFNPRRVSKSNWNCYESDSCICIIPVNDIYTSGNFGSLELYEESNHHIISFENWCARNGIVKVDTTSEVTIISKEVKKWLEIVKPLNLSIEDLSKYINHPTTTSLEIYKALPGEYPIGKARNILGRAEEETSSVPNETFPKASKVEGYTVDNSNPLFPKIKLK